MPNSEVTEERAGYKCPRCGSTNTVCLGSYQVMVAVDDAVDVLQLICDFCHREWEV